MTEPRRRRTLPRLHPIGLAALLAVAGPALALPQGATVVSGQVRVATPSATLQVVTQGSARGIVDWNSFSLAAGERVRFDQPSAQAVLLNRVTGSDPSRVFGQIQSNGQIFLLNPNGVVFGASARIDVGGLVASSLSLTNADFLAGRYALGGDAAHAGAVRNDGLIRAPGGTVALVAPQVGNHGTIEAAQGRVGLAAGQKVRVDLDGDGLVFFELQGREAGNRLAQLGRLAADGGSIELRAAARATVADTVLNMSGIVQARGLGQRDGRVVIDGGAAGLTRVDGTVDVSGELRGGHAEVTGAQVQLDAGTRLLATGAGAGGTVLVGGNWQGQGPQRNAAHTEVAAGVQIDVSATGRGDGGTAVVWSDGATRFQGHIAARGGAAGGDGGRIEVSGKHTLAFAGTVDARAPQGRRGSLLLDPSAITIQDSGTDDTSASGGTITGNSDTSILLESTLNDALDNADVTVDATQGGTGGGASTITVADPLDLASGNTLTLKAGSTISLNAGISNSGDGGLNLYSNGSIVGSGSIDLAGGSLRIGGTSSTGSNLTRAGAVNLSGDILTASGSSAGSVTIRSNGDLSAGLINTNAGGSSGDGDVTLDAGADLRLNDDILTGSATVALAFGQLAGGSTLTWASGVGITAGAAPGAGISVTGGSDSTLDLTSNAATITLTGTTAGSGTLELGTAREVTLSGIASVVLTGGSGANDIAAGSWNADLRVNASAGDDTLVGNGSRTTLAGPDATADWTLTGANDGTLASGGDTTSFTNAARLLGGSGVDRFAFQPGGSAASLDGGAGAAADNRLDVSARTGAVTITLAGTAGSGSVAGIATAFSGIGTLQGNDGAGSGRTTTLVGHDGGMSFTLTGAGSGTADTIAFDAITSLRGGSGADSFGGAGSLAGTLQDGGGATTLAGTIETVGTQTYGGAVTLGGATTLRASGAGSAILFEASVDGSAPGAQALSLEAGSRIEFTGGVGQNVGLGALDASAGARLLRRTAIAAGSIGLTLDGAAVDAGVAGYFGSGAASLVQIDAGGSGHDLTVQGAGALPALHVTGNLDLQAGADVTQTGVLQVDGTTVIAAGAHAIRLADFDNLLGGTVGLSNSGANAVELKNNQATVLGTLELGSGNVTLTSAGAVTQSGTARFSQDGPGPVDILAPGQAITLDGSDNAFSGALTLTGGAATVQANGGVTLGAAQVDTLTVNAGGAITQAGALAIGGASEFTSGSGGIALTLANSFGGSVTLAAPGAQDVAVTAAGALQIGQATLGSGALTLNAGGPVGQLGAITQTGNGAVRVDAGANAIVLDHAGNNFVGPVHLSNSGANAVALRDAGALQLGTLSLGSGTLSLQSGGALTQTGPITQAAGAPAVTIAAGASGDVTLTHALNDFTAPVAVSGRDIALADANDLNVSATPGTDRSLDLSAGALLTLPAADIDTGSGALRLSFGSLAGNLGTLSGGDITLFGASGLALGNVTAGGTLSLRTADTPIVQQALTRVVADGATTLDAGSGAIVLGNTGNDFRAAVDVTGGPVTLRADGALAVAQLNSAAGQAVSLAAGGALTLAAGTIDTGTADLTLASGTQLQTSATLAGGNVSLRGAGGLTLGAAVTARGELSLATTDAAITQTGGAITADGTATVDAGRGAVTLARSGNDFRAGVSITGGPVSLRDDNALTLASLSQAPDSALTLVAGGLLTLAGADLDTGTADLSLAAGSFAGGTGSLHGRDITLTSGGAVQLGDIRADRALALATTDADITQRSGSRIEVAGATTITTGTGNATLANTGNGFGGLVSADGGALALHGADALALGNVVARGPLSLSTGTGTITQGAGAITVAGPTTIDAGDRAVTLTRGGNHFGAAVGIVGGEVALADQGALQLGSVQATRLDLTTGGALTQSAAASVSGTLSVDATGHDITLDQAGNRFGTVALAGNEVTVVAAGDLALGATAAQRLAVTTGGHLSQSAAVDAADATLAAGGDLTLTDAANRLGRVDLSGAALRVRAQGDLTVTGLRAGTNQAVALSAGGTLTLPLGDILTGTADLRLESAAGRLATRGHVAGRQVTLLGRDGITLGGDVRSRTDQHYASALTLAADATLDAGGAGIAIDAGVAGAGHALTVAGEATLQGNVTGTSAQDWAGRLTLASDATLAGGPILLAAGAATGRHDLTLGSAATLGGPVSGAGHQTYQGRVTLADDVLLQSTAGRIHLQAGLDGAGHALTLASALDAADAVRTGGRLAGLGALTVDARATLGADVRGNGDQRWDGAVTLAGDATLDAGAGTLVLAGAVDGGGTHRLTLASRHAAVDAIRTGAAITGLESLTVDGNLALGGNVTTGGSQRYQGRVQLARDLTLAGDTLRFDAAVDGAQALTLRAAGLRLGGDVGAGTALAQLTVQQRGGAGTTRLGGQVRTEGTQTWEHALLLDGDATLSGRTLHFQGTIDDTAAGAHTLTLRGGSATTRLDAAVGATTALRALDVTGPATLAGGHVGTTGAQRFDGAVTLAADTTLSAGTLVLTGRLDGAHALTLDVAGTSTLGGVVGGRTALDSLSARGDVDLRAAAVTTTGAQDFGAALQLAGDTRLDAASLRLAGPVRGAGDLLLRTDRLEAADVSGSGVLRITPRSLDTSIGIAGGAGTLQIGQALVTSAGGFTRHEFGRRDGTGAIQVGPWRLGADTVLQSGRGELHLGGRVDGAFALALDTGGLTRITAPIGTLTPLAGLSTDRRGTAGEQTRIDGGAAALRIVTSGDQTWGDALETQRPVLLVGRVVRAEQDGNRFGAPLSVAADSLQLRSPQGIELGELTLAQGGTIESGGVLLLRGDLQLDAGTLRLVSHATPSAGGFTDPDLQEQIRNFGPLRYDLSVLAEASATILQGDDSTVRTASGSRLELHATRGGTIQLLGRDNTLLGELAALSGAAGDAPPVGAGGDFTVGFVRVNSSELHLAGLEADALWLSADRLSTGSDGLIRARLPYLDRQGSNSSLAALTLVLGQQARDSGAGFGSADGPVQVQVGGSEGGFLTVRPRGVGDRTVAVILLRGPDPQPFYDGAGKATEIRVFYNGDAPRTPEETGALTAVTATVEDARQTRFEETVRTENVKSRLRSGVIAEVGSGRPATVGRESIRLPENCSVQSNRLQCQ